MPARGRALELRAKKLQGWGGGGDESYGDAAVDSVGII